MSCLHNIFVYIFLNASLFSILYSSKTSSPKFGCAKRRFAGSESFVCICNSTHCDRPMPPGGDHKTAIVYLSDPIKYRLHRQKVPILLGDNDNDTKADKTTSLIVNIRVNASRKFQTLLGFGGAFTDSAGFNLASLSKKTRLALLGAYFDKRNGIRYTIGRVPMGGSDCSVRLYSYCDMPEDLALRTFALAKEDLEWKIPNIRLANKLSGGALRLFASPWSAPGWMKTNGQMVGAGALRGALDGPYYEAFANYFRRFFEEYKSHGNITFWGLTLTNEPLHGARPGMDLNSTMQREWANRVLAPLLKRPNDSRHVAIMAHDDNRHLIGGAAKEIFGDWSESTNAIAGLGFHWYSPPDYPYEVLSKVHSAYPDKFLLATEACTGPAERGESGPSLGNWTRASLYAHDIIEDLNNWAVGWVDWNICLDLKGGPNWVDNFVDSPVIVNASADEFYKQPMFYAMAHFSRFMKPQFVRIDAKIEGPSAAAADGSIPPIEFVAAAAPPPHSQRVLVLQSREGKRQIEVKVRDGKGDEMRLQIPPKGIATLIWHHKERKAVISDL